MDRVLPKFVIEGTAFWVDVNIPGLRQIDCPANVISFLDMEDKGDHYTLLYDRSQNNYPRFYPADADLCACEVPQMVRLDPVGMAEKYGLPVEALDGKSDLDIMVDQQVLEARLNGRLPEIDIAGEIFIVDLKNNEMKLASNPAFQIEMWEFDPSKDGTELLAYYQPDIRQIIRIKPNITEVPHGAVALVLPNEVALDPVYFARAYNIPLRNFLMCQEIRGLYKARVTPILETGIMEVIERNRRQLGNDESSNTQGRGRGRGL